MQMHEFKPLYIEWRRFELPALSEENWQQLVVMIGKSEFVIISADSGEDVQGRWVKNVLEISPQGRSNLRRCSEVLSLIKY